MPPPLPPRKAEVGRAWQLAAAAEINKPRGSWMDRVQSAWDEVVQLWVLAVGRGHEDGAAAGGQTFRQWTGGGGLQEPAW